MEALTSSCSKALLDASGSSSPQAAATAIRFSDKLQLCFSHNENKVGNFGFLQMVHHKAVFPVYATPSETQVEFETLELQDEQTEETKVVRVKFQLQKGCKYGEQFLLVGDDPVIGTWDPSNALPMTWSEGHVWFLELDVPVDMSIQYKFILKGLHGEITWQPGSDRVIQTWDTVNRITVCEDWDNAKLQKIIEEEEEEKEAEEEEEEEVEEDADHSNGKPQIDSEVSSEMSNMSEILDHHEEEMASDAAEPLAESNLQQIIVDSTSSSVEKPMAIVAENIGFLEEVTKTKTRRRGRNNVALQSENGEAAAVKNQGNSVVKGNLFDFEGGPVLVPGLNPPDVQPEETTAKAEVEERTSMDASNGESEAKDQNLPEFSEEQESDDGTPHEITETLSDEAEQVVNEHEENSHFNEHEEYSHLVTAMEEMSDSDIVHEDVLQNDIDWGRGMLKKFLFNIGLF